MTNDRVCANGTAVSLADHLGEMQHKAMLIEGLLHVHNFMRGEGLQTKGREMLCTLAEELAGEMNQGLDAVNLPEVSQ